VSRPPLITRRRVALTLAAVLATSAVGAAVRSEAIADPIQPKTYAPLVLAEVRESVDYLTKEHGISQAEALRRLELQRTSADLDTKLAAVFPDTYGGMWLDQVGGGTLVINATKPAEISAALKALPERAHITVAPVAHSRRVLEADAKAIAATYGDIATVDEVTNTVVVHPASAQALQTMAASGAAAGKIAPSSLAGLPTEFGALAKGLDSALAPYTATGRVRVDQTPPAVTHPTCQITACGRPLRAGLEVGISSSLSGSYQTTCTNGFNLHGSNGWQYSMTAGHCLTGNLKYTRHNGIWVGSRNDSTFAGSAYPWDGAITPYVVTGGTNYAEYWLTNPPRNRVRFNSDNWSFPILGSYTYEQIKVGWSTCLTGATSGGTRCGVVTAKDGGIVTDSCVKFGDSGGPVFSQVDHKAYAIISKVSQGGGTSCPLGVRSYNSPLSKVFSNATSGSGITFGVNTG